MSEEQVVLIVFTMLILAGVAVLWMAMHSRRGIREMEHRERLAMIERGLMPPPETNPAMFERRAGLVPGREAPRAARGRSAGVILIGFGLSLILLISFVAGEPGIGIGIGGAFAVLGAAFLINAMLASRYQTWPTHEVGSAPPVPASPPTEPPSETPR